jgi:gas vesicle protein
MKGLVTGIFLGVGIGLLLAPQSGEETRRLLNERWQTLRENELVKQYLPVISDDFSQTQSSLGDLAQFALSRVKANDSTLTALARLAVDKLMSYQVSLSLNDLARLATMVQRKAS